MYHQNNFRIILHILACCFQEIINRIPPAYGDCIESGTEGRDLDIYALSYNVNYSRKVCNKTMDILCCPTFVIFVVK